MPSMSGGEVENCQHSKYDKCCNESKYRERENRVVREGDWLGRKENHGTALFIETKVKKNKQIQMKAVTSMVGKRKTEENRFHE